MLGFILPTIVKIHRLSLSDHFSSQRQVRREGALGGRHYLSPTLPDAPKRDAKRSGLACAMDELRNLESLAKTMKENAEKFNPAASQEAFKPVLDPLKAWGDLARKQAQVAQAAVAETAESFKSIKEPQAAFEAMKMGASAVKKARGV